MNEQIIDEQLLPEVAKEYGFSTLDDFMNSPETVRNILIGQYLQKYLEEKTALLNKRLLEAQQKVLETSRQIQEMQERLKEMTLAAEVIQEAMNSKENE